LLRGTTTSVAVDAESVVADAGAGEAAGGTSADAPEGDSAGAGDGASEGAGGDTGASLALPPSEATGVFFAADFAVGLANATALPKVSQPDMANSVTTTDEAEDRGTYRKDL
jgi:hypothetical protein